MELGTKRIINFCTEQLFDLKYQVEKMTGTMQLPLDGRKMGFRLGKEYNLHILYTNDPTPSNADDVVSLGYFNFNFIFKNCRYVNTKPMQFMGWDKLFKPMMLMPMRKYT